MAATSIFFIVIIASNARFASPPPAANASVSATKRALQDSIGNPSCASCHATMDPIGFTLERYDATGRWRDTDQGEPIDTTGSEVVDGTAGLVRAIKGDPRFPECATRKLFTYAFARAPDAYDEPTLASLRAAFGQGGHRMRDLIIAIAHSDAFRTRHGGT